MTSVQVDYEPRPQFEEFHARDNRWSCIVAHRRAGKTVACVNDLITRATYTQKKNARYAYIAPFYRQAKDVAWVYLKEAAEPLLKSKPRESELRVELFNGAWITLYGADNPDALRGIYLDGVVLDEYGDCRPSLWGEVILPTLTDRKGWAVFIGTPKGHNHFWEIKRRAEAEENWFYAELRASKTLILDKDELKEAKAQMTDDQYRQEYECDFEAAVLGAYYANIISEMETQTEKFGDYPHDPDQPVYVATDLGYTDSTAMWFWQLNPDGPVLIDYEEEHSQPLSYYFDLLNSKPYDYDTVWLPHDARAKSLQTGRSTIEQFLEAGFPCNIAPRLSIQHGVDAGRLLLPRCHFNISETKDGVEALRAYRRQYNEITKAYTDRPLHDWSSHGADAFRYFALVTRDQLEAAAKPRLDPFEEMRKPAMTTFSLGQMFQDNDRVNSGVASMYRKGWH